MLSNHLILCLPLSFCLQSFPASGSFPMNWLFMSGGQSRIPDPKDILDFWSPSHPTSKMKFVGRPSWPRSYESFFFFFFTHSCIHSSIFESTTKLQVLPKHWDTQTLTLPTMFHEELVSWLLSPTRALCRHSSFSPACVLVWPVWVLVIYNLVLFVLAHFLKNLRLYPCTILCTLHTLCLWHAHSHTHTWLERDWVGNTWTSVFERRCPVSQFCTH